MITFVRLQFKRLLSLSYEEYCLSGFELHFSTRESSIFQLKKQAGWKALQPCEVAISLYYRFLSDNVGVPSKYINFLHHYVSHKHTHTQSWDILGDPFQSHYLYGSVSTVPQNQPVSARFPSRSSANWGVSNTFAAARKCWRRPRRFPPTGKVWKTSKPFFWRRPGRVIVFHIYVYIYIYILYIIIIYIYINSPAIKTLTFVMFKGNVGSG